MDNGEVLWLCLGGKWNSGHGMFAMEAVSTRPDVTSN